VNEFRDEFLSEEDLDLCRLSQEEPSAYWDQWLLQAVAGGCGGRAGLGRELAVYPARKRSGPTLRQIGEAPGAADYEAVGKAVQRS
jgi:hypothetical protein